MTGRWELVFPPLPYIVVYQVTEHAVEIARIFHGAQDRFALLLGFRQPKQLGQKGGSALE
jgi:hypothetical protein